MGRGLCARHYSRYYLRGTTKLTAPQRALPPAERFRFYVNWEPCDCGECDGCLRWQGGKNSGGYGLFYVNGEKVAAHRFAYEMSGEAIPEHYQIDHVRERGCRHRDCVKREHLEPVSLQENLRRAQIGRRKENGTKVRAFFAQNAAERFWAKTVQSGGQDAHWPWLGFTDRHGNAKVWWQGSTHMAREIAWLLANGPLPEGQIPQQTCGRSDCMNPGHMVLVDRKADQARRAALARAGKAARRHPETPEN